MFLNIVPNIKESNLNTKTHPSPPINIIMLIIVINTFNSRLMHTNNLEQNIIIQKKKKEFNIIST